MTITEYLPWFKSRYRRTSSFLTACAFIVSDLFAIMLCIGAGFFVVNAVDIHLINFKSFVNYWTYLPFFFLMYNIFKLYPGILLVPSEQLRSFFLANAFMFGGIALSIVVETEGRSYIAIAFIVAFFFSVFVLPLSRVFTRNYIFSRQRWWGIPAVVYGDCRTIQKIIDNLVDNTRTGYIPVAIVDVHNTDMDYYRNIPILHSIEESKQLNSVLHIKMAIIVPDAEPNLQYQRLLLTTLSNFRYNIIITKMSFMNTVSMHIRDVNGVLAFATTHNLTKFYNLAAKRALDLMLLLLGSIFVIPLMLIISLLIKMSSPGPVFYGHERIGKNGKKIRVWKFRSMVINADKKLADILASDPALRKEWEQSHKLRKDPRITPIGRFLRKTSLDELPQLFNILVNDMSFIGPRPVTAGEIVKYGDNFDYIFSVKPGLSGMWQVSGRSDTDYAERVTFDSYYIQNWTLWLDIWLVMRTIGVVLTGKGAR